MRKALLAECCYSPILYGLRAQFVLNTASRLFQKRSTSTMTVPVAGVGQRLIDDMRRVHVLGIGNIGKLFAHSLAVKSDPCPVTLLLHRPGLVDEWKVAGQTLDIVTNGVSNRDGQYDIETVGQSDSADGPINNLIIATKAARTADALQSIRHRLNQDSTILFAQNGMGTVDEVKEKVFPKQDERPAFLNTVVSHGLYTTGTFSSVHAGALYIAVGSVPGASSQQKHIAAGMVEEVVSAPILKARHVDESELLCLQLEKITVNAMMNPLTVIFDCKNGDLAHHQSIIDLIKTLLSEVSKTILALPELKEIPGVQDRFSQKQLENVVFGMVEGTKANTSSMLQDRRAGRETEIDYITGYLCRRAKEVGVDCAQNLQVVKMIKDGTVIKPLQTRECFRLDSA